VNSPSIPKSLTGPTGINELFRPIILEVDFF